LRKRAEEASGAGRHARRADGAARHADAAKTAEAAGNGQAAERTGATDLSDTEQLDDLPFVAPDSVQPGSLVDDILGGGEIR
jgi:hypothetical protein